MGLTDDPNDPRLGRGIDQERLGQQHEVYLVLSESERKQGFVRPLRHRYIHLGLGADAVVVAADLLLELDGETIAIPDVMAKVRALLPGIVPCGTVTWMNHAIAETYARDPRFYGATWCAGGNCLRHPLLTEFLWVAESTSADRVVPMVVGT